MYYVYLHVNETGVFYVGCGTLKRAETMGCRPDRWKQVAMEGYSVLIVKGFDTLEESWECEKDLISYFKPSCNRALGGPSSTGCIMPPEARMKISLANQGENHPQHKLTSELILRIRQESGTQRGIARRYGISQKQVANIKFRRTWRHLP